VGGGKGDATCLLVVVIVDLQAMKEEAREGGMLTPR